MGRRGEVSATSKAPFELEVELARRAATGERRAQATLAQRVVARVRKIARSLATTATDADDASQLSLIEVLRSVHTYRGEASLEHWAGRIATRTTLRHLSRERRRRDPLIQAPEPELPSTPSPTPFADDLPRSLRDYLSALPDAQRTALVLHHALGHSIDEVAELTEVSRNTVKGRLRLGVAALRKHVRREQRIGARTTEDVG